MSSTLVPPENDTFPNRIRWTVDDCERLLDSGCLNGRFELIDGEIISKMGQGPLHSLVLQMLAEWLINCFGLHRVRTQLPLTIPGEEGATTEPEPDLIVTTQPRAAYARRHPRPEDAVLIIEVSDTTLKFDLGIKSHMYARAGVAEYWVVDMYNRQIHVHRIPSEGGFGDVSSHACGEAISIPGMPGVELSVDAMLPPLDLQVDDTSA